MPPKPALYADPPKRYNEEKRYPQKKERREEAMPPERREVTPYYPDVDVLPDADYEEREYPYDDYDRALDAKLPMVRKTDDPIVVLPQAPPAYFAAPAMATVSGKPVYMTEKLKENAGKPVEVEFLLELKEDKCKRGILREVGVNYITIEDADGGLSVCSLRVVKAVNVRGGPAYAAPDIKLPPMVYEKF